MSATTRPEFCWPVRVYYEDTDAGGVVYHSNYLKYMERARTEWLRALGFEQDQLIREQQVIFAVRQAYIDYLLPARFNESLEVSVKLGKIGGASLSLSQSVARADAELCRGAFKIACLNSETLRPRTLPSVLATELQNAC
jgi:acyl-CoA thioester hydrolase